MSNYLAIAAVTATLKNFLQEAVGTKIPNARVKTVRPDLLGNDQQETGINLFMYQALFNPSHSNNDLPTRRQDGSLTQRPQVALDLCYLITFFGDENLLEPQRLMGSAISSLHARPIFNREIIRSAIEDPQYQEAGLAKSDLAEQVSSIKFHPITLNLEELSKLWSVFFQAPYLLSVAYRGTLVLIEDDTEPSSENLPVRDRKITLEPFVQ